MKSAEQVFSAGVEARRSVKGGGYKKDITGEVRKDIFRQIERENQIPDIIPSKVVFVKGVFFRRN